MVVHKYTGLARKLNRGVVRGVRVDPQIGSAELAGGATTSCGGSNLPDPPAMALDLQCMKQAVRLRRECACCVSQAAEENDCAIFIHPWDMQRDGRMKKYFLPWLVGKTFET